MKLDPLICFQALKARDSRFDGHFFVGVHSTGIYCRPVCDARLPQRAQCRFFPSAAAAEAEGFRPCLRCRPELAPGCRSSEENARVDLHAASLIEAGGVPGRSGIEALARHLGISARQLRRRFHATFGVTPIAYAQTHRLLLAKRLLTDTHLPVIEVAMASGFSSLRRFNALFRARYRLNPSELRRASGRNVPSDLLTFSLSYRPPFDWDRLRRFLAQRTVVGVESFAGERYRRSVRLSVGGTESRGWITVGPIAGRNALEISMAEGLKGAVAPLLSGVRRLFDLEAQPDEIADALGPLAASRPGVRLPGAFDGFETGVRAILGQQVSVQAARTLAGRFVACFGERMATPFEGIDRFFPTAAQIADLRPAAIAGVGIVMQRARAIWALSREVASGALRLEPGGEIGPALRQLRAIPGIGEWTAQYLAMRVLGWPDAFPHTDLGVMKAMGERRPARVRAAAEKWRPWRAYAVMHLWHQLEETP